MEDEDLIKQIKSADYWKCPECGEIVETGFDACWNCQHPKPEKTEVPTGKEIIEYEIDGENEYVSVDPHDYWKCKRCGQIIDMDSDSCWNCKNIRPEEIEYPTLTDILQYQPVEEREKMIQINSENYWKCPDCGQTVEIDFNICWNCQGAKPENIEHPGDLEVYQYQSKEETELKPENFWKCPKCGQTVESIFGVCWNCQNIKPEETYQPSINEIINYQEEKKSFDFIKSGFGIIAAGLILLIFSGLTSVSEELGFESTHYGRFLFGIFFIICGFFFLILGYSQKLKK